MTPSAGSPQTIAVTLTLTDPPPALNVAPSTLTFTGTAGGSNPANRTIALTNTGGGTLTWTAASNQPWLTLSTASGTAPSTVTASVNLTGLTAGTLNGQVTVTPSVGPPQVIAVTLTLADPPPTLSITPTSVPLAAVAGGPNPAPQLLAITNPTGGALNWSVAIADPWLSVTPLSGTGPGTISVTAVTAGLAPATYTSTVTVNALGATGSPTVIPVTLTVLGVTTTLNFSGVEAGAAPTAQAMAIQAPSGIAWVANRAALGDRYTRQWRRIGDRIRFREPQRIGGRSVRGQSECCLWRNHPVHGDRADARASTGGAFRLAQFLIIRGRRAHATEVVVANTGGSALTWTKPVSTDQPWLSATPAAGSAQSALPVNTGLTPLPVTGVPTTLPTSGGGQVLHNGIALPPQWPPVRSASQAYTVPSYLASPPAVIPIDIGRQLFVDDFLIESTTLVRTRHVPRMINTNPILAPQAGDRYTIRMPFSDGVWFDPADNKFKVFYFGASGYQVYLIESLDGTTWLAPGQPVLNIGSGRDSALVWLDQDETNPARRWKAFAYYPPPHLRVYFSPDGRTWTEHTPSAPNTSDRTTAFRNPFLGVFTDSVRIRATVPAETGRISYFTRLRLYSETSDFLSWTPNSVSPESNFWTGPDVRDPTFDGNPNSALPELYNLDATPYESLMVGLFSWFYSYDRNGPGPDIVEIGEGFSRDGYQWWRPFRGAGQGRAFIAASNAEGTWNRGNTQSVGGGFLVVGDELWFYFSGRDHLHSDDGYMATGLAKMRRDGFVSLDAGGVEGTVTTRPVSFTGRYLFVNVDAPAGALEAEIVDSNGVVIPAFSRANCNVITTNSTMRQVTWTGGSDLSSLAGQAVKIRFYITNGRLYSFWVAAAANGASNGYVAAGGPGFGSNRDIAGAGVYAAAPRSIEAPEVTVSVSTAGLAPGTYTGKVSIASPGVTASPREVTVTLTVP
ncbi:MAG: hypothetical protein R2762_27210 [Bryobacteraceae bacterium]